MYKCIEREREERHISENGSIFEGAVLYRYHFGSICRVFTTPVYHHMRSRTRWLQKALISAVLKGDLIANLASQEGRHSEGN